MKRPLIAAGVLAASLLAAVPASHTTTAAHTTFSDLSAGDFSLEQERTSNVGLHLRGRQTVGGVPVDGSSLAVHLVDGEVVSTSLHRVDLPGRPTAEPISASAAVRAAATALGATDDAHTATERLLVAIDGRLVDVWRVDALDTAAGVAGQVDVDAATGAVVAVGDDRRFAEGIATVFDPNPIVRAKDSSLRQTGPDLVVDTDLSNEAIDAQMVGLPVRDYDPAAALAGRLTGPWVDVQAAAPLGMTPFGFRKEDPRFEAVMAYTHIDRFQRYVQDVLGMDDVNAEAQWVITAPVVGYDNSFYMPALDVLAFGHGGVDDAEDAEVILHEYGHAIHDAQVPGWGATAEGGAMGEGWGDFLAGSYFARTASDGFQDLCIADWDAVSYSTDDPACLRRMDSTKTYPDDLEDQVHADGELWSAFLWRLRDRLVTAEEVATLSVEELRILRSDRSLELVLTSHEFLDTQADFAAAIDGLHLAADALGHPEWSALISAAADETGMPDA